MARVIYDRVEGVDSMRGIDIQNVIHRGADRISGLQRVEEGKTVAAVHRSMEHDQRENEKAQNLMRKIKQDRRMQFHDLRELDFEGSITRPENQMLTERAPQPSVISAAEIAELRSMGLDVNGAAQPLYEINNNPFDQMNYMHPDERAAVAMAQRSQRLQHQMLDSRQYMPAAQSSSPRQSLTEKAPVTKNWAVKSYLGETRGGGSVQVWKVMNSNGFGMETPFRIEAVARKIAFVLNETNNVNDRRIVALTNLYNKRDAILKEVKKLSPQKANPGIANRINELQASIQQIDYQIGI